MFENTSVLFVLKKEFKKQKLSFIKKCNFSRISSEFKTPILCRYNINKETNLVVCKLLKKYVIFEEG